VLSDVQLMRAVEIFESWLKKDALSLDPVVHVGYSFHHSLFLIIIENLKIIIRKIAYSLSSDALNGGREVSLGCPNSVQFIKESLVVNKSVGLAVTVNKILDLSV
jgi:hypothetical protein